MKSGGSLSIWFFIGVSLASTGCLFSPRDLRNRVTRPSDQVVLYDLHANVWWGAVVAGSWPVSISLCFSPARERAANGSREVLIHYRSRGIRILRSRYVRKENDDGRHHREPRIFSRPVGEVRTRRDDSGAHQGRHRLRGARSRRQQARRGRDSRRSQTLCRIVSQE